MLTCSGPGPIQAWYAVWVSGVTGCLYVSTRRCGGLVSYHAAVPLVRRDRCVCDVEQYNTVWELRDLVRRGTPSSTLGPARMRQTC